MRNSLGVLVFVLGLIFASVSQAELFPGDDSGEIFVTVTSEQSAVGGADRATAADIARSELFPGDDASEVFVVMPAGISRADDGAGAMPASMPQPEPVAVRDEGDVSAVEPADAATTDDASGARPADASDAKLVSLSFRGDASDALVLTSAGNATPGEAPQSSGIPELDPYELNENPGDLPGIID